MQFNDALVLLASGHRVRRKEWAKSFYVYFDGKYFLDNKGQQRDLNSFMMSVADWELSQAEVEKTFYRKPFVRVRTGSGDCLQEALWYDSKDAFESAYRNHKVTGEWETKVVSVPVN